jgi:hypothetical protein
VLGAAGFFASERVLAADFTVVFLFPLPDVLGFAVAGFFFFVGVVPIFIPAGILAVVSWPVC